MSVGTSLSCSLIKSSNAFVFLDPEPLSKGIMYVWSGRYGYFGLCSALFSFLIKSELKIFVYYENGII